MLGTYLFVLLAGTGLYGATLSLEHNTQPIPSVVSGTPLFQKEEYPAILLGGDIMLSRSVGAMTKKHGVEYITESYFPFGEVSDWGFVLLNLESPFSYNDRDKHERTFYFASHPRNVAVLSWLTEGRMPIISLANNHIFNASYNGLEQTITSLDEAGITYVGLTKNQKNDFVSLERAGRLYCFGGYTYDGRSYHNKKTGDTWYVHTLDDTHIDLENMNAMWCDEKIFMIHWGREYKTEPTTAQTELAHTLIDNGATMIVGGHSHILGKIEQYKGRYIFYSLGNFIFDQEWGRNGCEPGMDCIYDEKQKRNVVPTHIGTAALLRYPYTDVKTWQWDIVIGKLEKRE